MLFAVEAHVQSGVTWTSATWNVLSVDCSVRDNGSSCCQERRQENSVSAAAAVAVTCACDASLACF